VNNKRYFKKNIFNTFWIVNIISISGNYCILNKVEKMRNKKNIIDFVVKMLILFLIIIFITGCRNITSIVTEPNPSTIPVGLTSGSVIIEDGAEFTKDCTPVLSIQSENAIYMSFSGDGESWSEWVEYGTSYEDFNIASGLHGTEFKSGIKCVYIRFKDEEGNLSPEDELAYDIIEYEIAELFSIGIIPQKVKVPLGGSYTFTLHGYDLKMLNEVPLDSTKAYWTKSCGVGSLSNITGLSTTYTAPRTPIPRDISAHYNNLGTGAMINVVEDN